MESHQWVWSDMLDTHLRMIILTTVLRNFGWQAWKHEPSPGKRWCWQRPGWSTANGGWWLDSECPVNVKLSEAAWWIGCGEPEERKVPRVTLESSSLSPESYWKKQSFCLLKWEGCEKSRAQETEAVKTLWVYLLAALGLQHCALAFSSCGEWGLLFIAVCELFIVVASLAAEHKY